ncbi:MAG: hypothetical protein ABII88_09665 [Candidatus Omnitrophota bacterium]
MDFNMGHMIFAQNFHRQSEREVKKLSRLQQDYMARFLRLQLTTLNNVLSSVENAKRYNGWYFKESMRHIEKNIHRFRKECSN